MSDTPRTDAKEQRDEDGGYRFVSASFARELERENARLRDDCLRMARALGIEEQYLHLLPNIRSQPHAEDKA